MYKFRLILGEGRNKSLLRAGLLFAVTLRPSPGHLAREPQGPSAWSRASSTRYGRPVWVGRPPSRAALSGRGGRHEASERRGGIRMTVGACIRAWR